jgi:hypothetical protein
LLQFPGSPTAWSCGTWEPTARFGTIFGIHKMPATIPWSAKSYAARLVEMIHASISKD